MDKTRLVRASEVGEYVFCQHAWWLHTVEGHPSTNVTAMARGTRRHRQHGQRLSLSTLLLAAALVALLCAALASQW